MDIEYDSSKDVKCYKDFVLNPSDRNTQRAFSKTFGKSLMEPAKKLHDRLKFYVSAGKYNEVYGSTNNRIEIKNGCSEKEPLILKVRVGKSERKFFNNIIDKEKNLLLKKDWSGNFDTIKTIYVIAINNHDYKNI